MKVLSPFGVPSQRGEALAKRLRDPVESTVVIVENGKPGSKHLLSGIQMGLEARGISQFKLMPKASASRPHQDFESVVECADAVVLALGDCGSCTSGSILDCVEFEKRGIPTVTIVSQLFEAVSQLEAASKGLPEMPIVIVPHPIATRSQEELELIGMGIAEKVLAGLSE